MNIDEQVDALERIMHPEGRCLTCGGGKPYWKHTANETEWHPFAAPPHRYDPRPGDTWCRACNSALGEAPHDSEDEVWLAHLFEDEYCAECGGDAQHHTVVPFLGNPFAR